MCLQDLPLTQAKEGPLILLTSSPRSVCSSEGGQGFPPHTEASWGARRKNKEHFVFFSLKFLIRSLFLPVKTKDRPTPAPYGSPFSSPFPVHPFRPDTPCTQESRCSRRLPRQCPQGCQLGCSRFSQCSSHSLSPPSPSLFFLPPPKAQGPSQLGVSWGGGRSGQSFGHTRVLPTLPPPVCGERTSAYPLAVLQPQ